MVSEHDDAPPAEEPSSAQDKVVSLEAGKAKRSRAAAKAASSSPSPEKRDARTKGDGGGARRKKVDWGKFEFLVEHFALIYGTDTVWDGANRLIMKISNMAHAHGSDVVKIWKTDPKRRTVMPQNVVFDPTEKCDRDACVNLFGGFELEPEKGKVDPFLELGQFLTSRASDNSDECDEIFHWIMCWLAYPLQHPGAKLRTSIVMHGDEGAGKNFFFECILDIYGRYGALVGQDELEDKFNDWRSGKCMVIGDEVATRQELVHQKNRLKALITSPTVQINPKNLPRREERNHINIVFLSNELQPLALDNTDRRYLVIYTPLMRDRPFYEKLKEWREDSGVARLYRYLLDYPLDGFDPYAPAPATQAKRNLIDLNRKSPERFWLAWASDELDLPYRTCATNQAYRAYLKYCQRTGDRFPMQQAVFTAMVVRVSESIGQQLDPKRPPVREWMAKVTDAETSLRKTTRLLLVTPKPDGVTDASWASECVSDFEHSLRDYLGYGGPPSPDGDSSASKGGAP